MILQQLFSGHTCVDLTVFLNSFRLTHSDFFSCFLSNSVCGRTSDAFPVYILVGWLLIDCPVIGQWANIYICGWDSMGSRVTPLAFCITFSRHPERHVEGNPVAGIWLRLPRCSSEFWARLIQRKGYECSPNTSNPLSPRQTERALSFPAHCLSAWLIGF